MVPSCCAQDAIGINVRQNKTQSASGTLVTIASPIFRHEPLFSGV
jgi:hypothetical protein